MITEEKETELKEEVNGARALHTAGCLVSAGS